MNLAVAGAVSTIKLSAKPVRVACCSTLHYIIALFVTRRTHYQDKNGHSKTTYSTTARRMALGVHEPDSRGFVGGKSH